MLLLHLFIYAVSSSANQSIHTIGRPVSAPPNSTITNSSIATLTSALATSSHTEADTSSTGSFMPRRVSASTSTTALVPETCTVSTTTTNSVATTTSGISSANDDRGRYHWHNNLVHGETLKRST